MMVGNQGKEAMISRSTFYYKPNASAKVFYKWLKSAGVDLQTARLSIATANGLYEGDDPREISPHTHSRPRGEQRHIGPLAFDDTTTDQEHEDDRELLGTDRSPDADRMLVVTMREKF